MRLKEAVKPARAKIIICLAVVLLFIALTFYGKFLVSQAPVCELSQNMADYNDARLSNNTVLLNEAYNKSVEMAGRLEAVTSAWKFKSLINIYSALSKLTPFIPFETQDLMGFAGKEEYDCFYTNLLKIYTPNTLENLISMPEIRPYNPYFSFKNLALNSLIFFIEAYVLVSLIFFVFYSIKKI